MKKRWVSTLAVVGLIVALIVAVAAVARSAPKVTSTVLITSGKGTEFTGKVNAAKKKCRAGRTVKLYRDADSSRGKDMLVGTARTNSAGNWTMDGSFLSGIYFVQVIPILVVIEGRHFQCLGDMSLRAHY